MTWLWLGLLALSGSWLFLYPVFMPEVDWPAGLGLAILGQGLLVAGCRWSKGFWFNPPGRTWRQAAGMAVWLGLMIFGLQFLVLEATHPLTARYHEMGWLSHVLQVLCSVLGVPASVDQGVLLIQTDESVLPFVTNWEKVGLIMPISLAIAVGVVAMMLASDCWNRLKRLGLGLGLLAAYTLVRYLVFCGWLIEFGAPKGLAGTNQMELFTHSWTILLSYVPLVLVLAKVRVDTAKPEDLYWPVADAWPSRPWLRRLPLAVAGGLLLVVSKWICLPGEPKGGRILVDDYHSGFWEQSAMPFTTNGYGAQHLYAYSSMVEWFRHHYRARVNSNEEITESMLREVDVLVLKTPSRRFTPAEVAVITAWVRQGGGLLLLGDHTNLLGMSSFLNEIISPFGVRFKYDASNAYSTGFFSTYRPPFLLAHPIVQALLPMEFMTTCTLDCDLFAESVMIGRDLVSDPIDYSKPSFFGRLITNTRTGFGTFPLGAVVRVGKGQILVFAESTMFSNFSLFLGGNAEFLLRSISYLNQTNRSLAGLKYAGQILGLLLFWIALWQIKRMGLPRKAGDSIEAGEPSTMHRARFAGRLTLLVVGGLVSYWLAGLFLRAFNAVCYPLPAVSLPYQRVAYLKGAHFQYHIPPAIGPSWVPPVRSFDSVFVVPQRLGAFPCVITGPELEAAKFKAAVLLNPDDALPTREKQHLQRYLDNGGNLILLLTPRRTQDSLPAFLSNMGGSPRRLSQQEITILLPTNTPALTTNPPASPAAIAPTNHINSTNQIPTEIRVTWAKWTLGKGVVHMLSDSGSFSRAALGNVMNEPNEPQLKLYRIVFDVFQEALGDLTRPPEN